MYATVSHALQGWPMLRNSVQASHCNKPFNTPCRRVAQLGGGIWPNRQDTTCLVVVLFPMLRLFQFPLMLIVLSSSNLSP